MSNGYLRPCPFCGGEANLKYHADPEGKNVDITIVYCTNCSAAICGYGDLLIVTKWNERANMGEKSWVSVKDALPAKEGEYLTIHESGTISTTLYNPMMETDEYFGEWEQHFVDGGWVNTMWIPVHGITHWMELPELPAR